MVTGVIIFAHLNSSNKYKRKQTSTSFSYQVIIRPAQACVWDIIDKVDIPQTRTNFKSFNQYQILIYNIDLVSIDILLMADCEDQKETRRLEPWPSTTTTELSGSART